MEKFNNHAPCLDKNCSICCNPVKINQKAVNSGFPIPKDADGNEIWKRREEVLAPEDRIDTDRVSTFDCVNYDKEKGKCLDYEKRPDICRNTSCITGQSGSIDEQHRKATEVKFIKIK